MANSRFAYVRDFELPDPLLPHTYLVFRLDGHSFHRFSEEHDFAKPNDRRALELMDCAAREVMSAYPDIVLGFGESDEYSFLLRRETSLYNRRQAKITSTLTSYFTANYVFHWARFFPDTPMKYPPSFDGRIVLYPGVKEVRNYFAWRQADTHINNLYNTAFWALVLKGGQSTKEAHATLRGTVSKQKHEILFTQFGINYNTIDERYKKGSILTRTVILDEEPILVAPIEASGLQQQEGSIDDTGKQELGSRNPESSATQPPRAESKRKVKKGTTAVKTRIDLLHCDIIKDEFWDERPELLDD